MRRRGAGMMPYGRKTLTRGGTPSSPRRSSRKNGRGIFFAKNHGAGRDRLQRFDEQLSGRVVDEEGQCAEFRLQLYPIVFLAIALLQAVVWYEKAGLPVMARHGVRTGAMP